jgi:hypothetical protein
VYKLSFEWYCQYPSGADGGGVFIADSVQWAGTSTGLLGGNLGILGIPGLIIAGAFNEFGYLFSQAPANQDRITVRNSTTVLSSLQIGLPGNTWSASYAMFDFTAAGMVTMKIAQYISGIERIVTGATALSLTNPVRLAFAAATGSITSAHSIKALTITLTSTCPSGYLEGANGCMAWRTSGSAVQGTFLPLEIQLTPSAASKAGAISYSAQLSPVGKIRLDMKIYCSDATKANGIGAFVADSSLWGGLSTGGTGSSMGMLGITGLLSGGGWDEYGTFSGSVMAGTQWLTVRDNTAIGSRFFLPPGTIQSGTWHSVWIEFDFGYPGANTLITTIALGGYTATFTKDLVLPTWVTLGVASGTSSSVFAEHRVKDMVVSFMCPTGLVAGVNGCGAWYVSGAALLQDAMLQQYELTSNTANAAGAIGYSRVFNMVGIVRLNFMLKVSAPTGRDGIAAFITYASSWDGTYPGGVGSYLGMLDLPGLIVAGIWNEYGATANYAANTNALAIRDSSTVIQRGTISFSTDVWCQAYVQFSFSGTTVTTTMQLKNAVGASFTLTGINTVTNNAPVRLGLSAATGGTTSGHHIKQLVITVTCPSGYFNSKYGCTPNPVIYSIIPSSTNFDIIGNNFGPSGTMPIVVVDSFKITCSLAVPETTISCTGFYGCSWPLAVTTAGTYTIYTTVQLAPVLTAIAPVYFPTTGATLSITGKNFLLGPTVTISGAPCPILTSSNDLITCTVPAGVGWDLPIVVTTFCGQSSSLMIHYNTPSVTTTTVVEGSEIVTLTGSNMGPSGTPGTLSIIGGSDMACVSSSHTSTTCTGMVPFGRQDRQATLNIGGQSAILILTVTSDGEDILSVEPAVIPAEGGPVAVTMTTPDFGDAEVTFGGVEVPINMIEEVITANIPAGQGCGIPLVVTTTHHQHTAVVQYAAPEFTAVNSPPTEGGTLVVAGENFGPANTLVEATCTTADISGCLVTVEHTEVSCTVAAGSGAGHTVSFSFLFGNWPCVFSFSFDFDA